MTQPLWYVRKDGTVTGPFPAQQLRQAFSLGELDLHDQVSLDRQEWLSLMESNVLDAKPAKPSMPVQPNGEADDWRREREKARLRWLNDSIEVHTEAPRPSDEVDDRLRRHEEETRARLRAETNRRPAFLAGLAALLLLLAIGVGVWRGQSGESGIQASLSGRMQDCSAAPAEGVVWSGCDKSEARLARTSLKNAQLSLARLDRADLTGADLSYANLDGVNLRGANLRGAKLRGASLLRADLTGADLTGTDLDFAVLTGAFVDGARLDGASLRKATWIDGRQCGEAATGSCQ